MKTSAGLMLFRRTDVSPVTEVLLAHMGGPLWAKREQGAWGIPKGESEIGEDLATTARREFSEELGLAVPSGEWHDLGMVTQSAHKQVQAWAIEADLDPAAIIPGTFEMEWPPRSGQQQQFPEIDRVAWWSLESARGVMIAGQIPLLDRLALLVQN